MQLSMFSSAGPPANHSASPDSERAWLIRVATSPLRFLPLLTAIGPSGWSGRTSPACCRPTKEGRLVPSSEGWANSGMGGPTESLDAQYFGVAQRRRRVFVVASARGWQRAAAVLFDGTSLRGDSAPSREAGQGIADGALSRALSRVGGGDDPGANKGAPLVVSHCEPVSRALTACGTATGRLDPNEQEFVAHSLRGEGFDASSEDGTGRGTPLVPVAYRTTGNAGVYETGDHVHALTTATDPNSHVLCFSAKDHGADAGPLSPTLRSGGHGHSHANGGVMPAVCIPIAPDAAGGRTGDNDTPTPDAEGRVRVRPPHLGVGKTGDPSFTVAASSAPAVAFSGRCRGAEPAVGRDERPPHSMLEKVGALDSTKPWNVAASMAVRRLTPRECERLQGFPDDYTLVPYRGKPAADGPRYKALGNSMAVPVMAWIGRRIQIADGCE